MNDGPFMWGSQLQRLCVKNTYLGGAVSIVVRRAAAQVKK